jgi:hypothetical protein
MGDTRHKKAQRGQVFALTKFFFDQLLLGHIILPHCSVQGQIVIYAIFSECPVLWTGVNASGEVRGGDAIPSLPHCRAAALLSKSERKLRRFAPRCLDLWSGSFTFSTKHKEEISMDWGSLYEQMVTYLHNICQLTVQKISNKPQIVRSLVTRTHFRV